MKVKEYKVDIYSNGIVHCSVCTDAPRKLVATLVNEHNPAGTEFNWSLSNDKTFSGGEPNPSPCESDPSSKHYLMVC